MRSPTVAVPVPELDGARPDETRMATLGYDANVAAVASATCITIGTGMAVEAYGAAAAAWLGANGLGLLVPGLGAGAAAAEDEASNCFPSGTLVRNAAGLVAIDTIRPGTLLISLDERTGETSLKRVSRTMVHRATELVHVRTAEDTVTATPTTPSELPVEDGWSPV